MAHRIAKKSDGTNAIMSTKPTWHELESTKYYDKEVTSAEAIIESGANFTVAKVGFGADIPFLDGNPNKESEHVIYPDKFITYRTDTRKPLGIVGSAMLSNSIRSCLSIMITLRLGQISEF